MKFAFVFCAIVLLAGLPVAGFGQSTAIPTPKKKITRSADMLDLAYQIPEKAADVVVNEKTFMPFAEKLRADIENILREYEIEDKATLQKFYITLLELDLLAGRYVQVLERLSEIQGLNKSGTSLEYSSDLLFDEAIATARKRTGTDSEDAYRQELRNVTGLLLSRYDLATSGPSIKRDVRLFDLFSENFVLGVAGNTLAAEASNNDGKIKFANASRAVSLRVLLTLIVPFKEDFKRSYSDYLSKEKPAANVAETKPSIWDERKIVLTTERSLKPVVIAVWDSGVETSLYPNQLWMNMRERSNGRDNDRNGFVGDLHGIGFKNDVEKTNQLLPKLSDTDKKLVNEHLIFLNGMADFQSGKDTAAAGKARQKLESMGTLKPEEREAQQRTLAVFAAYVHGSHVAGIMLEGNPAARLMTIARIFDLDRKGRVPTTIEWSRTFSARAKEISAYLKKNNVRVVNISFGDDQEFFERLLKENSIAADDAERKKLAAESFRIYRTAFYELIRNSPTILFVCSAGNSDNDSEFTGRVPQSLDLPNLIAVGAVDGMGKQTRFTSFGKRVRLYANGSDVESYIPGGEILKMSGTSQASPQVANLAAKLFAIQPKLSVFEAIDLIKSGATIGSDGKLLLINPKHSVELLTRKMER